MGVSHGVRFWRRAVWISGVVMVLAVLSLAPYFTSSTELVRIRHALVLADGGEATFEWTPAGVPGDFLLERAAPAPVFVEVVSRLGLAAMPNDWERAVAISRHLLASGPVLRGGAIQSDLVSTYRRIVGNGEGYCGDFARVFFGLAIAAGIPVRAWAFSFDGFGGHGHVWPEIWNRQVGRWQLLDVYNNAYFVAGEGVPLSALEVRHALLQEPTSLHFIRLHPDIGGRFPTEKKRLDYYRRGLPEWYMVWGNNVFSYDRALLVRSLGPLSRSLEQLGGIVQGVMPGIKILAEPNNQRQLAAIYCLRFHVYSVVILLVAAGLSLLASLLGLWLRGWASSSRVTS